MGAGREGKETEGKEDILDKRRKKDKDQATLRQAVWNLGCCKSFNLHEHQVFICKI